MKNHNKTQLELFVEEIIKQFDQEIERFNEERNTAFVRKEYSKVSGLDGIGTGLVYAKKIINRELKSIKLNSKNTK